MARIRIGDIVIEDVPTSDVPALVRELRMAPKAQEVGKPRERANSMGRNVERAGGAEAAAKRLNGKTSGPEAGRDRAIVFLNLLTTSNGTVSGEQVQKAFGLENARALGPKFVSINNALRRANFKPDEVYTRLETSDGYYHWKPNKLVSEALDALTAISE